MFYVTCNWQAINKKTKKIVDSKSSAHLVDANDEKEAFEKAWEIRQKEMMKFNFEVENDIFLELESITGIIKVPDSDKV